MCTHVCERVGGRSESTVRRGKSGKISMAFMSYIDACCEVANATRGGEAAGLVHAKAAPAGLRDGGG